MSVVYSWWVILSAVSIVNIGVWIYLLICFVQRKCVIHSELHLWRKWIFWLSGVYVFVCAFRSFLPRIDIERVCLVQTWLSNMFVGRSLATIAELSFIVQCAILLREIGIGAGVRYVVLVSGILVPIVVIAESASWYAILTTNYLGSVIEESLWTVAGMLILISFVSLWSRVTNHRRYYLAAMIAYAIGFVIFMVSVDVPMYWTRWQHEVARNMDYLSLWAGLQDTLRSCTVNFSLNTWRQEIPWMTLYFTVTVWVSMAFAFAPSYKVLTRPDNQ